MDVIAAHTFGFTEVVASNGTAITEKQSRLLRRHTPNIVLVLDADFAGLKAATRGSQIIRESVDPLNEAEQLKVLSQQTRAAASARGRGDLPDMAKMTALAREVDTGAANIRIVRLPAGEDPDSLLRRDVTEFEKRLAAAAPLGDFLFEAVQEDHDWNDPVSRARGVDEMVAILDSFQSPVLRMHYVQKVARIAGIQEQDVLSLLRRRSTSHEGGPRHAGPRPVATKREVTQAKRERAAVPDGETQLLRLVVQ